MNIERAIEIAAGAHKGQVDKAGEPYILHPLRLLQAARTEDERVVAVLHDVVEDTDWTIDQLRREGLTDVQAAALDAVTRRISETYEEFIERAGSNELARAVKILDLKDNADLSRISSPSQKDLERMERYHRALDHLNG
ncbi:phosphohydrolase [Defluviimonas sp. SAOS-178_SWC]|uniref:phosphohydrolase n=1 Tax=Defluviimonas sp. SAOS-178_SWC TaxID=3121287 RepID=UPI0032219818